MVISENDFKNILIWDDLVLSRLYGKDIPINNMDKDRDLREIVQIMDWLPERILSIKKQLNVNSIPLIRFLGLLHSLNYTFDKIIRRGYIPYERVKEYREHLESTANARRSFLSYSDAQARDILVSLTENAFMLGYFAMERVVNCVSKYKCKNVSNNLSLGNFLLTIDSGYEFYVAGENYIDLVFRQKIENKIIPVPMEWALHWKVYGEIDGMISKKIRNAFTNEENIKGDVETKIRSLMHRRIVHCNSMADFLLCNGFAKGLYKFGWFFNR